jgi:hypothetical protein
MSHKVSMALEEHYLVSIVMSLIREDVLATIMYNKMAILVHMLLRAVPFFSSIFLNRLSGIAISFSAFSIKTLFVFQNNYEFDSWDDNIDNMRGKKKTLFCSSIRRGFYF